MHEWNGCLVGSFHRLTSSKRNLFTVKCFVFKMASTSTDEPVRVTKKQIKNLVLSTISESETELIKTEFNEKLYAHFLPTKNSEESLVMSNLRSRESLNAMMQKIRREEEKSRLDSSYINIYRNNYKILEYRDGKERFFFKDVDDKFKILLAWEDIFDIFWDTHLKYCHPKAETLKLILQRDYIVNDFAVETISDVCYTCAGPRKPYYRCALDLMSMEGTDFAFSHIMTYQDMCSGFIHLRPICADSKESEICIELFRIFMDFGPPKEVIISNDIFLTALDQIKHLTSYAPIQIEITKVSPDQDKLNRLSKKIRSWMTKNNFENWGIACYGVQLHLNIESTNGKKSPYDSVFKKIRKFEKTTCFVEDLTQVEFDSCAFVGPSDVQAGKGVYTAPPIDNNAMSFLAGTEEASPDSHSTDVEEVDGTYAAIETEFNAISEDEILQCENEDPLAID